MSSVHDWHPLSTFLLSFFEGCLLDRIRHLGYRHQRPRHLVQQLIRVLFLRQRLRKQGHNCAMAQLPSQISGRAVARDLIMLDSLRGADQGKISRGIFFLLAFGYDFITFRDKAFHNFARLRTPRFSEQFEALVDTLDLALGLGQVLLEQFTQLVEPSSFGHFRQRFD
jgi:hypothetical protein